MKLFRIESRPGVWVGESASGALVEFPARQLGYLKQLPYEGRKRDLVEVDPRLAARTGWPGCPRGRKPRSGEAASHRFTFALTSAEWSAWDRAARRAGGKSITEWARRLGNEAAGVSH